jgi:hypothetical protein
MGPVFSESSVMPGEGCVESENMGNPARRSSLSTVRPGWPCKLPHYRKVPLPRRDIAETDYLRWINVSREERYKKSVNSFD